jgi:anaerobic selenocysteine-containing dehydrogenase
VTLTETRYSVCPHDCPDTCRLKLGVEDGCAVSIRGDEGHPFTQGFLCVKQSR